MMVKRRNLSTRFVETELYQMASPDKFLPVMIIIALVGLIYFASNQLFRLQYIYYIIAIVVAVIISYWVQWNRIKKVDRKNRFLKFNKKQVVLMTLNLAIIVIPTAVYRTNGGSWEVIFRQFLVAFWETGTFGVTVVFALLLLTRFARKNTIMETGFFALIIGLSTLAFTIAHVKVYGLDPFKLVFLFVFGFGFNFISFSINTSLGITLHYLNNIVVYNQNLVVVI